MARYATVEDYLTAFPMLDAIDQSNLDYPGESYPNDFDLEAQLEAACDRVDGRLAMLYATPLTTIPTLIGIPQVIRLTVLYTARFFADRYSHRESLEIDFKWHWKEFEKVADGNVPLLDSAGNVVPRKDLAENQDLRSGISFGRDYQRTLQALNSCNRPIDFGRWI